MIVQSDDRYKSDARYKMVEKTMKKLNYDRSALIETLHTAQETFGYLENETLKFVARRLKLPYSKVYGVATFYHFFRLKPKGKHTVVVCMGTACYIKGADKILAKMEEKFGIKAGETTRNNFVQHTLYEVIRNYDLKDFRSYEYIKGLIEAFNTTSDFRREHVDEFLHDEKLKEILLNDRLIRNYCTTMNSRLNLWGNTTHLSVIDELGNAVSVTTTNGEGSGHVIPSSGIMLNNMMGEEDLNPHGWFAWDEGIRLPSMMAPTAVLKDGLPKLILGSAGSNRIRSAITQTIINNLEYGMNLHDSINSPRTLV